MRDTYTLQQCFTACNVPSNYLGILLKCRLVSGYYQGSDFLRSSQIMLILLDQDPSIQGEIRSFGIHLASMEHTKGFHLLPLNLHKNLLKGIED